MSVNHYENFPVASLLCPAPLRAPIRAIYRYARTADDLADEGSATAAQRLSDLAAYRADLEAVVRGDKPQDPRWRDDFEQLGVVVREFELSVPLLRDLLSAFEQDVHRTRYASRHELLDYCRRSANPVGRLLLHLHGITDERSLVQSDAICTALQLANFCQDVRIDAAKGRVYVPHADLARYKLDADAVLQRLDTLPFRSALRDVAGWACALMRFGAPLALRVPGRAGWELRLVVQGGLRILEKLERRGFDTQRPTLGVVDFPVLAWRACMMRRQAHPHAPEVQR